MFRVFCVWPALPTARKDENDLDSAELHDRYKCEPVINTKNLLVPVGYNSGLEWVNGAVNVCLGF